MKSINCRDIYKEETERFIKSLKRFREAWMSSHSNWNEELFQYADDDYYFYRFCVDRQENTTEQLLINIICRVMIEYEVAMEDSVNSPFNFIFYYNNKKIGFRFNDFYDYGDVNKIVEELNLDGAVILRTWKVSDKSVDWISHENKQYEEDGLKLRAISIHDFYKNQFGEEEYKAFIASIDDYLKATREITGYQSISFLSTMNLASLKLFEEKILAEWDYKNYRYQIIDVNNELVRNYLYISHDNTINDNFEDMEKAYVAGELYRTMVGANEYAESFITSEWLYYSLKEKKNFDYTSVISGYLKSIEQLLYQIVMLNIDNNCKIAIKNNLLKKVYNKNITAYESTGKGFKKLLVKRNGKGYEFTQYPYIDFTSLHKEYMDSSIGTFEHFLRNNKNIFSNPQKAKLIADMISCFRIECRNGFFHTHNLNDWNLVDKTRQNAIYLYFTLLGSCIIPEEKKYELAILDHDEFDNLCRKIREFKHYSENFIFEYDDGKKQKVIYDFLNNTAEFNDEGIEHYEKLLFYKVEFFEGALEKLDEGIRENQKLYLTRDNLPRKIYVVHKKMRNFELEELLF